MQIEPRPSTVHITGLGSFDLLKTLECGQAFRWNQDAGRYVGVVGTTLFKVRQVGDALVLEHPVTKEATRSVVKYFRLDVDQCHLEETLSCIDENIRNAVDFGRGLRIVQQPLWECIVSFIVSARNAIPLIKRSLERLSQRFGEAIEADDTRFYAFPTPEVLASADIDEIRACNVAYRADYIKRTAELLVAGGVSLENLPDMDTYEARVELMRLPGVGRKVADCILLFALGRFEVFPVDRWIRRVMEYFYFDGQPTKLNRILEYAEQHFGAYSGYVQEYLFYYSRFNHELRSTLQSLKC